MTLGNGGGDALLVVGAVARERRHLVEQGADLQAVIDILRGQRGRDDLPGAGIQVAAQLAPGPARLGALLSTGHFPPLAFHLLRDRILDQLRSGYGASGPSCPPAMYGLAVPVRLWPWRFQRFRPAA